jgi:hypothetical protein
MDEKLRKRVRQVASRVEKIVKAQFGLSWWRLTAEDEIRCLRLVQWEEKYRVPLEGILNLLVPIWKKKFSRYGARGLGVKIPTLVGNKSEEILKAKVLEQWPDGQNIAQWKALEQEWQWLLYKGSTRTKEDWEHPLQAAQEYQKRMRRERERRKQFSRVACQRRYRGNPWC